MRQYNPIPFTQLPPGTTVKVTDVYPAVDVTDMTESPVGTTKKYTIGELASTLAGTTWAEQTTTTATLAPNTGYIVNAGGLVTFTMPATFAVGTIFEIAGLSAGGWTIHQLAGQNILYGNGATVTSSTVGTGGSLSSISRYATVLLLGLVANTTLTVLSSNSTLTVI